MTHKLFIFLVTLSASVSNAQKTEDKPLPLPLPIRLTGDTRGCHPGYLKITKSTVVWKFAWATCEGENWRSSFQDGQWVLRMQQTSAQAKKCKMGILTLHPESDDKAPLLDVTAFESEKDMPSHTVMHCGSMDK